MELKPLVSVLIGSRDRADTLRRCLKSVLAQDYPRMEVLILDDGSKEPLRDEIYPADTYGKKLRTFRSDEPLGVAGGRNLLMKQAYGEIMVVLDDDATLEGEDCISRIVQHFSEKAKAGLLAFKIVDHTGDKTDLLIPFSRFQRWIKPHLSETERKVSYYLGGFHAIRREVIDKCGLYQQDLVYGAEELDLSFRIVKAGMEIYYVPSVVAHHFRETPKASRNSKTKLYFTIRNRIWLAYKYLPFPYVASYLAIWLCFCFVLSILNLTMREFIRGVVDGIKGTKLMKREPLGREAVAYLRENYGRLWY